MAPTIEFVGCAWLQKGCISHNLAQGSTNRVGITVFSALLSVSHSSCRGCWDWMSNCVAVEGFPSHDHGWKFVDAP